MARVLAKILLNTDFDDNLPKTSFGSKRKILSSFSHKYTQEKKCFMGKEERFTVCDARIVLVVEYGTINRDSRESGSDK